MCGKLSIRLVITLLVLSSLAFVGRNATGQIEEGAAEEAVGEEEGVVGETPSTETAEEGQKQSEWAVKGQKLLSEKNYAEAIEALTKAIAENSEDAISYHDRGTAYFELKKFKEHVVKTCELWEGIRSKKDTPPMADGSR